MTVVKAAIWALRSLFVDDGNFALAIMGIVGLAVAFAGVDAPILVTGGILVFGSLGVLGWSVLTASHKDQD